MLLTNSSLQREKTDFTGELLNKLKQDPGMIKFKKNLIKYLKANPSLKKIKFSQGVEFGGAWKDGNKLDVSTNSLTWAIRHADVSADGGSQI